MLVDSARNNRRPAEGSKQKIKTKKQASPGRWKETIPGGAADIAHHQLLTVIAYLPLSYLRNKIS